MPTEPVLPASELRARALQRLDDGRLPLVLATRIDAGYGAGAQCVLCDLPIAADKIEYDVTDFRNGKRLQFHIGCHLAWQRECSLRLRPEARPGQPGSAARSEP